MSATNITLELASLRDADAIASMARDLIEHGLGWSWGPARVRKAIANNDTNALVAREDKRVVAFAIMYFGDTTAHLNLLAVAPRYQRRGIGTRLLNWLIESALVAGITNINLELRATNLKARCFYRRMGFRDTALVPNYYGGRETAVRMSRDIGASSARKPA